MLLLSWIFVGIVAHVTGFMDFDVHPSTALPSNDEYIYHARHNLLLTIHEQGCYFAYMDGKLHSDFINNNLPELEAQIQDIIRSPEHDRKQPSTIEEMRDRFQDQLADNHCSSKDVYAIELDYVVCNFERHRSFCGWTPNNQETLRWSLNRGETVTTLTGPTSDHTRGNSQGQYIYLEANNGSPGDAAELISPALSVDPSEGMCLRFWYNMYGSGVGELEVYAEAIENKTHRHKETVWTMSGNQGHGWKVAEVKIPRDPSMFWTKSMTLHLRASKGGNIRGDIAVDDISSTPGSCISTLLSCDFEDDLCEWSEVGAADQMDWLRHSGHGSLVGGAPDSAPTTAPHQHNKYYIYINGSLGKPSQTADLQSPILYIKEPFCLSFKYFMHSEDAGELDIILLERNNMAESVMWSRAGRQEDRWLQGYVTVSYADSRAPVQVLIRAIRGSSQASDMAVDDIIGHPGTCEQLLIG